MAAADEGVPLATLNQKTYKEQAIWFLNGFYDEGLSDEAEQLWWYVKKFADLDKRQGQPKGENGNELDQIMAARFLEEANAAMTSSARKEAMRKIDQDNNGKMSLLEYCIWKYSKTVEAVENAPQGKAKEIREAQKLLKEVSEQLEEVDAKLKAQKAALLAQEQALNATKAAKSEAEHAISRAEQAESNARAAVARLQEAEQELQEAVAALTQQEEAHKAKIAELESISSDSNLGVVKRGKAKQELAQLLDEDPLPLRKAKLTQEAALRRVEAEKKRSEEAASEAEARKCEAMERKAELEKKEVELEQAKKELEKAVAELQAAEVELETKMNETAAELERLKKEGGAGHGALWWLNRELYEADERLPQSKQKYDHSKPFSWSPTDD